MPEAEFAALHRGLFDTNFGFAGDAARVRADLAGAGALPEVLAPVQHPRLERQHRRHRADRLHPAGAPAGREDRARLRRTRPTRPAVEGGVGVDRELLIEIGCEEIPASWLPGLTDAAGRAARRAPEGAAPAARGADRDLQHAAPADRARRQAGRAADRPRGAGDRAAGVGGGRQGRRALAGGRRVRQEVRRGGGRARTGGDAQGHLPGATACTSAAAPRRTCSPT